MSERAASPSRPGGSPPGTTAVAGWECRGCGAAIGYLGRLWQWLGIQLHDCRRGSGSQAHEAKLPQPPSVSGLTVVFHDSSTLEIRRSCGQMTIQYGLARFEHHPEIISTVERLLDGDAIAGKEVFCVRWLADRRQQQERRP